MKNKLRKKFCVTTVSILIILLILSNGAKATNDSSENVEYILLLSDPPDDVHFYAAENPSNDVFTDQKPYLDIKELWIGNNDTLLFIKFVMYGEIKNADNITYTIYFNTNQTKDDFLGIIRCVEYKDGKAVFAGRNITTYATENTVFFELPLQCLWDEGCMNNSQITGGPDTREIDWFGGGSWCDGVGRYNYTITKPEDQIPEISILSPLNNEVVSGEINISGEAFDRNGVIKRVEIRIDEGEWFFLNVPESNTTSWSYSWDTTMVGNGLHMIYARSWDGTHYSNNSFLTVNVNNKNETTKSFIPGFDIATILTAMGIIVVLRKRRKYRHLPMSRNFSFL